MLPVPAQRVGPRTILVNIDANTTPGAIGGLGLYARVSSHDQKSDLECQVARLSAWAAKAGHRVVRVEAEIASGMNGCRSKARRLLADPNVTAGSSSTCLEEPSTATPRYGTPSRGC
jgi:putative resolvase